MNSSSEREKFLERRIQEIEEKFKEFQNNFVQEKGKGRGKKSTKPNETLTEEQIDKEARKRLRSFLDCEKQSTSASDASHSMPRPSAPYCESQDSVRSFTADPDPDKYVFIRKIEVLLNGSPIDQVEDKQNEDECIQSYWRMFTFNGQMNSLFTNGIRHVFQKFMFLF